MKRKRRREKPIQFKVREHRRHGRDAFSVVSNRGTVLMADRHENGSSIVRFAATTIADAGCKTDGSYDELLRWWQDMRGRKFAMDFREL